MSPVVTLGSGRPQFATGVLLVSKPRALPVIREAGLPQLYLRWLRDALPGPVPAESNATCESCVMLPPRGVPTPPVRAQFSSETKCCTFVPTLPNFCVGGILAHGINHNSHGYESLVTRIRNGIGVSPLGVDSAPSYKLLYEAAPGAFGRSEQLRCPHYDAKAGGLCGIHQFRNAVCTTWHCKHVRGKIGRAFWQNMRLFLTTVEEELAIVCARRLRIPPRAMHDLLPGHKGPRTPLLEAELTGRGPEIHASELWGEWDGRTLEFFQACFDIINDMNWSAVSDLLGPRVRALLDVLVDSYFDLVSPRLPTRLTIGALGYSAVNSGHVRMRTYSAYDELILDPELIPFLSQFDGRPITEVLERLKEQGVGMDPELIQRLFDFDILSEPRETKPDAIH